MEAGEHQQLAKCIYYWLNYHSSVSRSDTLLESAIRFPLSEFIERRYKAAVDLECTHSYYSSLRLDFCYTISKRRSIEVKFLHDYTDREDEYKRFFDDLVRLALIKDSINYFILCGSRDLFQNKVLKEMRQIEKDKIPSDGDPRPVEKNKFEEILPLREVGQSVKFNPFQYYDYVGEKKQKDNPDKKIPEHLQQVSVQMVAKEDNESIGNQVVYIWRIR